MHDTSDKCLMMIEPKGTTKEEPVLDDLSRMACDVFHKTRANNRYRGFHVCACGECSDNVQHMLPDGTETNSLLPHYVLHHRSEVPQSELDKLRRIHKELFPHGT